MVFYDTFSLKKKKKKPNKTLDFLSTRVKWFEPQRIVSERHSKPHMTPKAALQVYRDSGPEDGRIVYKTRVTQVPAGRVSALVDRVPRARGMRQLTASRPTRGCQADSDAAVTREQWDARECR